MASPKREKKASESKDSKKSQEETLTQQKYQSVLLHLRVDYENNEDLYKELKKILDNDLSALYQEVATLTESSKDQLRSTATAVLVDAKTAHSKKDLLSIDGSIRSVISFLEMVNGQQKQLFKSMQTVKLAASSMSGTKLPFTDSDSQKLVKQADDLIKNLMTFRAGLAENLTMVHGKVMGLTLQHGKDLSVSQQATLVQQGQLLVKALDKQIEINQKLKAKLNQEQPSLDTEPQVKRPGNTLS